MGKKLYVGGLSYDTAEETLRQTFAQAGTVETVKVIVDRDTGRSKGFGFVEMATNEEAAKAIELFNGKELDGRSLTVNEAKPMEPRSSRPGGGYGNRDSGGGGNRRDRY
ncbi:MAG: RNA-binding protein [Planctomycetota bacterium]